MTDCVFISYSRRDFPFVCDLVNHLEAAGIHVWCDVSRIEPAEKWRGTIEESIRGATHIVLVVSPHSLASAEVLKEVRLAQANEKTIIPLLLQYGDVPEWLAQLQWIDCRMDFEAGCERLLEYLRGGPRQPALSDFPLPPVKSLFLGRLQTISSFPAPIAIRWFSFVGVLSGGLKSANAACLLLFLPAASEGPAVLLFAIGIAQIIAFYKAVQRGVNRPSLIVIQIAALGSVLLAVEDGSLLLLLLAGVVLDPILLWILRFRGVARWLIR